MDPDQRRGQRDRLGPTTDLDPARRGASMFTASRRLPWRARPFLLPSLSIQHVP
jgi:hypothetical protein